MKGSTGKEMMRFNLTANSVEDITVSALSITLEQSDGTNAVANDFTNVKLLKSDGTQLGSTDADGGATVAFSFNLTVPASQTVTLKVIADIPTGTTLPAAGGYFEFTPTTAGDITSTGVSSSASITETGAVVRGKTMAVGEGSLSISAAAIPGDQTVIIGSTEVPIVGLVMTAGSAEDVRVTRVKLT